MPRDLLLRPPPLFQVLFFGLQGLSLSLRFFFLCVILFPLSFDYHYFTNSSDSGFPTSSVFFLHSLNLGLSEFYSADMLFLGLGARYSMEFSLNVCEIKVFACEFMWVSAFIEYQFCLFILVNLIFVMNVREQLFRPSVFSLKKSSSAIHLLVRNI